MILVFADHRVDGEIAEAGILLPRGREPDVVIIVVAETAEEISVAVSLQVVRVRLAVRQHAIDVDVGRVGAAVLLAVRVVGILVHVARELEVEVTEPLLNRRLHVAKRGLEQRPVLIDRKAARRAAEIGARLHGVEAVLGHVHREKQIRVGQIQTRRCCPKRSHRSESSPSCRRRA